MTTDDGLPPGAREKIKNSLKLCIATLDKTRNSLDKTELRLKQRLIDLHDDVARLARPKTRK